MSKRILISLILLFTVTSCGTLKKMHQAAMKQAEDKKKLETHVYNKTLPEMKALVIKSFEPSTEANWTFTPVGADKRLEKSTQVKKALEDEGFQYKGKVYISEAMDVNPMDLINIAQGNKSAKDLLVTKANFHVLEENDKRIVIVKDNVSYEINKVETGSTMRVYEVLGLKRSPSKLKLDIIGALMKKGLFNVEKGAIDWRLSRRLYGQRNKDLELPLYYKTL